MDNLSLRLDLLHIRNSLVFEILESLVEILGISNLKDLLKHVGPFVVLLIHEVEDVRAVGVDWQLDVATLFDIFLRGFLKQQRIFPLFRLIRLVESL